MKFKTMLFLIALLTTASVTNSQQSVQMKAEKKDGIKAGDRVAFTVTLDRAPSVENVSLSIGIAAKDGSVANSNSAGPTDGTRKTYKVPIQIPPQAKSGPWHITDVRLNFGPGTKVLKFNDVDFTVLEDKKLTLPDAATVELAE